MQEVLRVLPVKQVAIPGHGAPPALRVLRVSQVHRVRLGCKAYRVPTGFLDLKDHQGGTDSAGLGDRRDQ